MTTENTQDKELQVSQRRPADEERGELTHEGRMYVPQVDIFEDEQGLTLRADLPGIRRDALDIDLHEGVLTLTARANRLPNNWRAVHREHDVGGFSRRFTLGDRIDQTKIEARFDNGVLEVSLPKAEAHKPRKIAIR